MFIALFMEIALVFETSEFINYVMKLSACEIPYLIALMVEMDLVSKTLEFINH